MTLKLPDVCTQEDVDKKMNRFCLGTRSPHAQVCTVKIYIYMHYDLGRIQDLLHLRSTLGGFGRCMIWIQLELAQLPSEGALLHREQRQSHDGVSGQCLRHQLAI